MARTMFETLDVYQLAEKIADTIWDLALAWPLFARNTVGEQIVSSADSIGANIAEGAGRGTPLENRRFLRIARGSLQETQHWLRRAFRRRLLTKDQVEVLKPLVDELGPRLNSYIRYVGNKKATKGRASSRTRPHVNKPTNSQIH